MSPRADRDGERGWECFRSLAVRFLTPWWRWSSQSKTAITIGLRNNWNHPLDNWPRTFAPVSTMWPAAFDEWRFNVPPRINLEEDIAQLEARMIEARPKGIRFSQSDILRAYAVQLHLKQIARLLRASRVETSRAIGETQE